MRSRKTAHDHVAEVARRRLELLSAELAATRRDQAHPPAPPVPDGSGEPLPPVVSHVSVPRSPPARPGKHARRETVSAPMPLVGWCEDRLPAALQGRVRIGAPQLSFVAVLVAAAMTLLAWNVVRAGDPGDLVPARSTPASPAPTDTAPAALVTPIAAAGAPSPSAAGEVVVDVAGKVRRPGIVRLPSGSRVIDAVTAAGGPRRGVDLSSINLARILVDGEQVVVGIPVPAGLAASAASVPGVATGTLVNVNTATQSELETLPGIGPVTAQAIMQWRVDNGAFTAVDELMEVSGIGEATLSEIAPHVTV